MMVRICRQPQAWFGCTSSMELEEYSSTTPIYLPVSETATLRRDGTSNFPCPARPLPRHDSCQKAHERELVATFLQQRLEATVSQASISRALKSMRWSKKTARQVAREQNADFQDYYLHKVSQFRSYQLVFIDELSCDKRISTRLTGWSPVGTAPV